MAQRQVPIGLRPRPARAAQARRLAVRGALGLVLLAVCLGVSCGHRDRAGDTGNEPEETGLRKTFERGPVRVDLAVDRKELTIAERLQFTIQITAQEDYQAELPRFGDSLEQFGIVDHRTAAPALVASNQVRQSRTYVLEPFLSGDYAIPPFKVQFWTKTEPDQKHELETEPLEVRVTSLLPEDLRELKLHEIGPPVELPRSQAGWLIALTTLGLGTAGVALGWWLRRRHASPSEREPTLPAHELAYRQLEELIAEGLAQQGHFKPFFQRVSSILRHYIENRFGLRAPEWTTEEFLSLLSRNDRLAADHKTLLQDFLKYCDLVKFAEHQPETSDVQNAFDACKRFIMETEPSGTEAAAPAAAVSPPPPPALAPAGMSES